MSEEARASPFEILSFGIWIAQEFEEVQVNDMDRFILAWFSNDKDLSPFSEEAARLRFSCQKVDDEGLRSQVRFEEIEEEELSLPDTEDLDQEILGFRQTLASDRTTEQAMLVEQRQSNLQKLMDQIVIIGDYINRIFEANFNEPLLKKLNPNLDLISTPSRRCNRDVFLRRVQTLTACVVNRIRKEAVGKNHSVKALGKFFRGKGLSQASCIPILFRIRKLRNAAAHLDDETKPRALGDLIDFIDQCQLADKIDFENEEGDFYPLYYEALKLNLLALTNMRDDILALLDISKRSKRD